MSEQPKTPASKGPKPAVDLVRPDYWQHDMVQAHDTRELNTLNLGPTHPATHGIFQNVLTMDGEFIQSAEQTIGYIHRAFEKLGE